MERFWARLVELAPESITQGFQPLVSYGLNEVPDDQPGFRVIQGTDAAGQGALPWSEAEIRRFQEALQQVVDEFEIDVYFQDLMVEWQVSSNDWTEAPDGQGYLRGLGPRGRSALQRRLVGEYQHQVAAWLEAAYQRHAPGELARFRAAGGGASKPGAD